MGLKKQKHLYEILLRFDADGFRGAHVVDLETITDDGEIVSAKELPARPITEEEVGSIIGSTNAKVIEQADAALAARHAMELERDNAKQSASVANERAAKAEGQLAGLSERAGRAEGLARALVTENEELIKERDELKGKLAKEPAAGDATGEEVPAE